MISDYPINKTATTAPLIDLKGEAFRGEQLIWTNGPVFLRGALSADGSTAWSAKAAKCEGPELRRRKRFPRRVSSSKPSTVSRGNAMSATSSLLRTGKT